MTTWKQLAEPVRVLTAIASAATALGAIDGLPSWVSIVAVVVVAVVGSATRQAVTPVSNPKDRDGVALVRVDA